MMVFNTLMDWVVVKISLEKQFNLVLLNAFEKSFNFLYYCENLVLQLILYRFHMMVYLKNIKLYMSQYRCMYMSKSFIHKSQYVYNV